MVNPECKSGHRPANALTGDDITRLGFRLPELCIPNIGDRLKRIRPDHEYSDKKPGNRMPKLKSIALSGYRSFEDAALELRSLNVLIGANGAGKSNLVSFFKMLNELMAGRLQQYVASTGHATSNLHFGPRVTPQLEAELKFESETDVINTYRMRLSHVLGDKLIFTEECLSFHNPGFMEAREEQLGPGHTETLIGATASTDSPSGKTARVFQHLLNNCRVFHFHDTSSTARVRNTGYVGNNKPLMPDAGNLAAVLHRLEKESPDTYWRTVDTIRQIAPFFREFVLEPRGSEDKDIMLNWCTCESDMVFGPHQLSDGTLRAICLVSLLMLPVEELPILIVIDEPELGLHPYALQILASLCRSVSVSAQVLISTQSSAFVSCFDPENIVVVEGDNRSSNLTRPDRNALDVWLDDYSLGEIWEKNVIGGGPH